MSTDDAGAEPLDGQSLDAAVETVLARTDAPDDEAAVRGALDLLTEDGIVRRAAVSDAVADVSMRVSNADGRIEYAAVEFEETAERVAEVDHVTIVADELADFEARLDRLESELADLEADLQAAIERDSETADLYELARAFDDCLSRAGDLHQRADRLNADLDEFENWVENVERKFDDIDTDLHTVSDNLDDIAETADVIEDALSDDGTDLGVDPSVAWVEATLQHRVRELVLADVADELAAAREFAEYREDGLARADEVEAHLADLEDRWERLGERLDEVARPAWEKRFGDDVAAAEERFDEVAPPVDWAVVQETLEEHLPRSEA